MNIVIKFYLSIIFHIEMKIYFNKNHFCLIVLTSHLLRALWYRVLRGKRTMSQGPGISTWTLSYFVGNTMSDGSSKSENHFFCSSAVPLSLGSGPDTDSILFLREGKERQTLRPFKV